MYGLLKIPKNLYFGRILLECYTIVASVTKIYYMKYIYWTCCNFIGFKHFFQMHLVCLICAILDYLCHRRRFGWDRRSEFNGQTVSEVESTEE